jgi:tetratricopeptide (TPR) repeat protein
MFCDECGIERKKNNAFCINCGKEFDAGCLTEVDESVHSPTRTRSPQHSAPQQRYKTQPSKSRKPVIAPIILITIAAIGLAAWFFLRDNTPNTAEGWLDLGERSLISRDYEQAVVAFRNVIEIEPKNPRGYTGAAEGYIGLEQPEEAIDVLRQGRELLPNEPTISTMLTQFIGTELPLTPDPDMPSDPPPMPVVTQLTIEETRGIAQAWLDVHPVDYPDLLDPDRYEEITHNGNEYFRFFHIGSRVTWFSILVNKDTGTLYYLTVDDYLHHDSLIIEPIDEWWYDWSLDPGDDVGSHFYNAVMSNAIWIEIFIYWEDGRLTIFTRNPEREWIMTSREGGDSVVLPTFSVNRDTVEIRFPTTQRVYYLYNDLTGVFGNESLTWAYNVRDG